MMLMDMKKLDVSPRKYKPLLTIDDLNENIGKEIFLLVHKWQGSVDFVGCESIKEVGDYAAEMTHIAGDGSSVLMIRATILDVENLPFEAEYTDQLFVLHESMTLRRFEKMEQVTSLIEYVISNCEGLSRVGTGNFAVLSGHIMSLGALNSMMTRINLIRRMSGNFPKSLE